MQRNIPFGFFSFLFFPFEVWFSDGCCRFIVSFLWFLLDFNEGVWVSLASLRELSLYLVLLLSCASRQFNFATFS